MTYTCMVSIQFMVYESSMKEFKRKFANFEQKELYYNFFASFMAGFFASGLTNSLEVLTVKKQTSP
jgi:hypothetical protein